MPKAKNTTSGTTSSGSKYKISTKDEARSEPLQQQNKDGATSFVFLATKSLEKSPSKPANKELKPNINEVLKKVSTSHTTQVVVDSTILQRKDICMKPLSEYMIKRSFQLSPVPTASSLQILYEDNQGGQFQLLFFHQGKISDKPRVFKYLHVKSLTYAYKDTDGNEYQPYHEPDGNEYQPYHNNTLKLLKSQVMELQADNAKLEQAIGASLLMPIAARKIAAK